LRVARERRGVSREDLARRIGLSSQQLKKLEDAVTVIPVARLQAAAQALGVSVDAFFPEASPRRPSERDASPMDHRETKALIEAYYTAPREVRDRFAALLASLARL